MLLEFGFCSSQLIPYLIDTKIVHHTLLASNLIILGWIVKLLRVNVVFSAPSDGVHLVAMKTLRLCRPCRFI